MFAMNGTRAPSRQMQPARLWRGCMDVSDLRIALFSGNYNYTRDGANQALNRLVGYLLAQGAAVRVYAPVVAEPDFPPTGDLVDVPNVRMPVKGRGEYRLPLGLDASARADLEAFAPNLVHISSPDPTGHAALKWAISRDLPVLGSVHTRFETYPRYYKMGFLEPVIERILRRFYKRCDALVAPANSMIDQLRAQDMHDDITLWSRGVDRTVFDPDHRDVEWRHSHGIEEGDVVIAFLGRLVMEKGLDTFVDVIVELRRRGVPHKVLIIGDGPAREWFARALPGGVFVGFLTGEDLARALASADVFFNPSITEALGNVTQEAMASGLPVVAAGATGSISLVVDGETGTLISSGDTQDYADALEKYCTDSKLRQAHGAAGEVRTRTRSWDGINQSVVDTYLRLQAQRGR